MKIHLASSPDPLPLGTDLPALCSAIVPRAEAAFFFNERAELDYLDILVDSRVCWQCRKEWRDKPLADGYIYGLMEGQEALEQKRSLAEETA